ncbi:MAG TPA: sodium:solute symporter family protein [Armatimonadota bacterium]|nr:sodium:solute symporter family protein [Armatimonadota bacterium]
MVNALVVLAYLVGTTLFGIYLARFIKKDDDFFLAGRSLNQWMIAGTVMAANVAAIYLVGPAGAAYGGGGVSVLLIAWTGNMIAAGSALFFVPRLRRLRITTFAEFLETRYSLALRLLVAGWWIIYYALFAGNAMYTLATVLSPVLNVEPTSIIIFVSGGVVLYCCFAGFMATAYSAVIQCFLMIIGGLILLPLCLKHPSVGGLSGLIDHVDPGVMTFWKSGAEYPGVWPTISSVIMFALLGLPYWCTSQYMLQCSFAGKNVRHASRGIIIAGMMTGVLTLSYIIPGICGQLIYQDNPLGAGDSILPRLLVDVLPIGLGGLIVAGLVAASNSTASALLAALATLAENDFFRRFLPGKTSKQYLWFGRGFLAAGGALGIVFAFYVDKVGIIKANFDIMAVFEPPIFVIVAGALFWRQANAMGATIAMVGGILLGAIGAMLAPIVQFIADLSGGTLDPARAEAFKLTTETRTFLAFPVCIALLIVGSFIGRAMRHETDEETARVDDMLARTRGVGINWTDRNALMGIGLAIASLAGFILCAVFEDVLPPPYNIVAFMGLMISFVVGCYIAVPVFMPDADEGQETETSAIDDSFVQKVLGSGWSWAAMGAFALVLVVILYLW